MGDRVDSESVRYNMSTFYGIAVLVSDLTHTESASIIPHPTHTLPAIPKALRRRLGLREPEANVQQIAPISLPKLLIIPKNSH